MSRYCFAVHVNGFFDLEDNRRHLKLADANNENEQSDKALMWNTGLIQEFLPDSYYALVQFLKEKSIIFTTIYQKCLDIVSYIITDLFIKYRK
jgi:hypothetical protein